MTGRRDDETEGRSEKLRQGDLLEDADGSPEPGENASSSESESQAGDGVPWPEPEARAAEDETPDAEDPPEDAPEEVSEKREAPSREASPGSPPPGREPRLELPPGLRARVERLEAGGDLEGALEAVEEALVGHEASAPLLLKRVALLGSLGRFDEAMEPIRTLRLLEPDSPRVHLAVGLLYFRRGLYGEAERDFRAASFRDEIPREIREQAEFYLAEALNRLERLDEALGILHESVDRFPSERSFQLLGRLYDRKGQPAEAAVMYRVARELQE